MILYSANDPGGANLVLHHLLRSTTLKKSLAVLSGPAMKVATDLGIAFQKNQNIIEWKSVELLIVGSSYPKPPKLHDKLLKKAQSINVLTVGVLDGWENFSIRWPLALPDQIWVMDRYAFNLARELYPSTEIHQTKNYYLEFLKENISKVGAIKNYQGKVVYLDSPRRSRFDEARARHKKNCICSILRTIKKYLDPQSISVRRHALTNPQKCVERQNSELHNCQIEISRSVHLYQDLQDSNVIVGKPSYALFAAKELGYKCYATDQLDSPLSPKFVELPFDLRSTS